MANRTVNVVITLTAPDAAATPMSTQYNVSTFGYKSPDSPFYFAPPRLASNVTFEKSIGTVFWGTQSAVDFGNIDIDITDGGIDEINGEAVRWVEWAKDNLNPQVVISIEQDDGTLLHIATADCEDVFFPNDRTIRLQLRSKFDRLLDEYVNDYFDTTVDDAVQALPVPVYLGSGGLSGGAYDPATFVVSTHVPTVLVDEANLRYVVTFGDLIDTSTSAYFVLDRGVQLEEDASPGFTLWENGFELTSNPDGTITFAWVANEGGGIEDPYETGQLLQGPYRICRWAVGRAGIDVSTQFPAESDFPDYTLEATFGDELVPLLYYGGEVSARQILNDTILNLSGYWYVDELGDFQFGYLNAPEATSIYDFEYTDVQMVGDISAKVDRAPGLSTSMSFSYNPGAYDEANIAPSVSTFQRRNLSLEWKQVNTTATVPDTYSTARGNEPMRLYNGGLGRSIAQDELDRRWTDYYSGIRRFYTWQVPLRGGDALPDLGSIGTIQSDKAELLANGELPVVLTRIRYDLGAGLIQMEGWGGETAEPSVPDAVTMLTATGGDSEIDLAWTNP
jgi:hypothetical protein